EPSTGGVDVTSQEAIGETGSRRSGTGERDQGTLASGARPEAAKEEIAAAPSVGTYFGPAATDSITGASKYPAQAGKGVGVPGETNAQVAAEKVATRQPGQPPVPPKAKTAKPVLGIDFDGTLFKENPDGSIGAPIPERIASLKEELAAGKEVEIESKRAGHPGGVEAIHAALESVGLPRLPVTAKKTAAPTLIDNEGIKEPGVEVRKVPTDANTPLPGTPERLEVPQSKSERHNEALRQAREKLGLNPGQTPTDFPGLSKLMKTEDDIERGMREPEKKPVTPQVPAMAGMTPLGAKPEVKANVEPKPEVVPVTAEGNQSWREAANVIQRQILTMPVDEARPALAHATETIQAANDPDLSPQEKRAMLDVAERHRVALDKEAELKVIAAQAGRQHFDVKGWLAEDFGDSGFGHVMAGDVLTKVALGDGYLDPAYNVDAQGIFVNPGP